MAFSSKNYEFSNETEEDIFGNRLIILKRVKSLKQLRRTEKELVRLNYKEAIIKGFTLKGIQQYIATKTKIWIEWSCMEYLKKAEEQENREWYYHMAKDHFAYIGAHRKCIDEIEQLKKELWKIIMNTKAEMHIRILAAKELHSLSKTTILFLRDLPFITSLSKLYDQDFLDSNYNGITQSKNEYSNRNNQQIVKDTSKGKDIDKSENLDKPFDSDGIDGRIALAGESGVNADKNRNKYITSDNEVLEAIQRQMHITDPLEGKNIEEITDEDLDSVITPLHKESIKRIEELLDD